MKRLAILLLIVSATAVHAERLQFADRFRIVTPSDPQISPDGKSIAVLLSRANLKDNRYDVDLVLIDVASGAQRPLTFERRGVAQPRWSPDGQRLAFLANASAEKDAKRQLWIVPMSGGDARRITDTANGVQQFAWSPDGNTIAFVTTDEMEKKSDLEKHNRSFEIGDDDYLTASAPMPAHVWLISSNGGDARRLTSGAWSLPVAHPPGPVPSPLSWSPDGKWIAITQRDTPHERTPDIAHVAVVDAATGAVRRLTKHQIDETQPVFSPDGSRVAYWHPRNGERTNQTSIWIAPASGGDGKEITTSIDRNLFRSIWLPEGKSFLTGGHDGTSVGYWIQPADGGAARRLDLGGVEPTFAFWIDASIAPGGAMVFTGSTPNHPREVYYMPSLNEKPRAITSLNTTIASLDLGRTERITWKNEGFDQDGVLITPPGFDATKKYPLIVFIHGGPRASSTAGFSFLPQLFAAQNWVVFSPNYRGSDNLGNRYTVAIADDSGAGPGRDVMAGIDAVKKRGFVDESRIGVGGWSYGGYMTSWMIGHYPIFKAAVSGAAVNNWLDTYTLADTGLGRRLTWGSPYVGENAKKYIDQSPITYAAKIKTPTLIMADTGDVRVPITQSYEMFHALRDNGVPVKFIAYPVSGHFPEDPVHQSDIDRRYVDWFASHLK